jgi:PEP-CTERM motif
MKTFGLLAAASLAALGALGAGSASAATNLLTNGSFETGDFTGWNVTSTESSTGTGAAAQVVIAYNQASAYPTGAFGESIPTDNAVGNPSPDAAGKFGAYFVSDFADPQTISQTVTLTAGTSYTFGFDIYQPGNGAANPNGAHFTADLAGVPFASFAAGATPAQIWSTASGANTFVATTTGAFTFSFTSDGFPAKDFVIDRVYLTATDSIPGVPEPASWALMIVGMGGAGAALRSRRRSSVATA